MRLLARCVKFNIESKARGVYNLSLTSTPATRYLVAIVTVTNVHHTEVLFSYGYFVLIARDGTAYYANYASAARAVAGKHSKTVR